MPILPWVASLVLVAFLCATSLAQTPEKRVALVIGNASYKEAPLKNPVNDARAMAARLRQLGFEVVARENATRREMASAVAEFARKLSPAGAALVYYAGHGIQSRGRNYLIPVDAKLESETDLRFLAVDVTDLTGELEHGGSRVSFVILDACRNNPFERSMRGSARGLAAVDAARGSLIAYATAPGSVASDGDGENGVYTAALLRVLAEPGLKAEEVFKRVRIDVTEQTRNQQTPWESSSLTGDFVFNLTVNIAAPPAAIQTPHDREALFWQSIQTSARAADFEAYLAQFPQGTFAALARNRLADMKQPQIAAAPPPSVAPARPDLGIVPIGKEFVATQVARLREGPDAKSRQLGVLKEGDAVLVLGKVKDQPWYQVERDGKTQAYVSMPLLEEAEQYRKRKETAPQQAAAPAQPNRARVRVEGGDLNLINSACNVLSLGLPRECAAAREGDAAAVRRIGAVYANGEGGVPKDAYAADRLSRLAASAPLAMSAPPAAAASPPSGGPGRSFRDCANCPEMVAIPAGRFIMGAPSGEVEGYDSERPQHPVSVRSFALGKYEVTRGEFAAFVGETGYSADGNCYGHTGTKWLPDASRNWRNPGFPQSDRDPAVCVNWNDAKAYVDWLSHKTGKTYRMPSEAEWEYAARAGTTSARHWGEDALQACGFANVADRATLQQFPSLSASGRTHQCDDGQATTAPVGRYRANGFGLHDMLGNAWEWTADCWNESYGGSPGDGSAWTAGDCRRRVLRGGSWFDDPGYIRSGARTKFGATSNYISGFRVARTN